MGIRACTALILAGMAQLVMAADPIIEPIDIPAEDLGTALLSFAAATHQQIAFDYKLVEGYKSATLSGRYTVTGGLTVLIGDAPFLIRTTPAGVLAIAAKPVAVASVAGTARGPPLAIGSAASASKAAQDEIVISAQRTQLTPKVLAFVNEISVPEPQEGLARWNVPVCPQVTGLPREDGEFILERISEVARAAEVPLAGENCQPNLFVFVTVDPKQLLKAMEQKHRAVTFGHATPTAIDEFIAAPRAARVWYDSAVETPDNASLAQGFPPAGEITEGQGSGQPGGSQGGGLPPHVTTDWERASRVARTKILEFTYVYVVLDQGRLQGVTRGQLADYVAMVGLAQIKPGAQLSDAPTILKLFDDDPQGALPHMSEWDHAFLKSLYLTRQAVKAQQGEIALEMVREISH